MVSSTLLAAGVTLLTAPANAGTFRSCTGNGYDLTDNVSGIDGCTISNEHKQDFLNEMTVNQASFFGETNWVFGGKIGTDDGFDGTGTGKTGNWDISSRHLRK